MSKVLNSAVKLLMLLGVLLFSVSIASDPAYAGGGRGGSYGSCHTSWEWGHKVKICHKTGSRDLPDTFNTESEGNFPSVCDGQVGYWTAIDMPGGKTFCVMHFTEFFKGGTITDGGSTATCTKTVKVKWRRWWHTVHTSTSDGACKVHTWTHPVD